MNSNSNQDAGAAAFAGMGILFVIAFYAILIGFVIWIYCRVAKKAGYPPAYGVFMIVPCLNFVAMIMFVFQEWPIEKELRELREALARANGAGTYPRPPAGTEPPPY